jgi:uncharacterized damage-inducible protein DinB
MRVITLPSTDEYNEFYADYVQRAQARDDVIAALSLQLDELQSAFGKLSDAQSRFKPGPEEWSIKEVLGHLTDVERVFSYRLLRVSRNDPTPLSGFEQDDYVREAGFDKYPLDELLDEFKFMRRGNIIAIRNMPDSYADRRGTASGFPVSARALIHMLVGHMDHHMASLHEKYLPTANTL